MTLAEEAEHELGSVRERDVQSSQALLVVQRELASEKAHNVTLRAQLDALHERCAKAQEAQHAANDVEKKSVLPRCVGTVD